MKYFIFSLDDGSLYDKEIISLFNKYGISASFNLNSGLDNFTWYYEDRIPITRLVLSENVSLYDGHEVASHSLTHPSLDNCPDEEVIRQVQEDINNLERTFNREIKGFVVPFDYCGDREVYLIQNYTSAKYIRLSEIDESFSFPTDPYHIKATTIDVYRALELLPPFLEREDGLFMYGGHSYDFFVNDSLSALEELLKIITSRNDIKIITVEELLNL